MTKEQEIKKLQEETHFEKASKFPIETGTKADSGVPIRGRKQ